MKPIGCKYMRNFSVSQIFFQKIARRGKNLLGLIDLGRSCPTSLFNHYFKGRGL